MPLSMGLIVVGARYAIALTSHGLHFLLFFCKCVYISLLELHAQCIEVSLMCIETLVVRCAVRIVSSNRCHIVKLPPNQAVTSLSLSLL